MTAFATENFWRTSYAILITTIISYLSGFATPLLATDKEFVKTPIAPKSSLLLQIEQLEQKNRFSEADSIYDLLDRAGAAVTGPHLLRWAKARGFRGDYPGMAELLCRGVSIDPRFAELGFHELVQALENTAVDTLRPLFARYQTCTFRSKPADPLRMALLFSDFYARHGMDAEELSVLERASTLSDRSMAFRFLDIARQRSSLGSFAMAVAPARLAFVHAGSLSEKAAAARLLVQSYRELRRCDSAVVWLNRAPIQDDRERVEAVTLYQLCGNFDESAKYLAPIAPSLLKDTLEIRQRLFEGKTVEAAAFAAKRFPTKSPLVNEAALWRVRTLLFSGRTNELSLLLDSVRNQRPDSHGAGELLSCRYHFQKLSRDPAALSAWARLEYALYIGKTLSETETVPQGVREGSKVVLLLRAVQELIARGQDTLALSFFARHGSGLDDPEFRYFHAATLLRTGRPAEAREKLTAIIGDAPGDIYSERARVLLLKISKP